MPLELPSGSIIIGVALNTTGKVIIATKESVYEYEQSGGNPPTLVELVEVEKRPSSGRLT